MMVKKKLDEQLGIGKMMVKGRLVPAYASRQAFHFQTGWSLKCEYPVAFVDPWFLCVTHRCVQIKVIVRLLAETYSNQRFFIRDGAMSTTRWYQRAGWPATVSARHQPVFWYEGLISTRHGQISNGAGTSVVHAVLFGKIQFI